MLDFVIDTSPLLDTMNISKTQFDVIGNKAVEACTFAVFQQIHKEANENLSKSRQVYKNNLNISSFEYLKGSITLTGVLPNMIEQGASAFDMKQGFATSPKAKQGKKGWYLTVPFRIGTPGAIAESEVFSSVMTKEVYSMAKKLKPTTTSPFSGAVSRGENLTLDVGTYGLMKRKAVSRSVGSAKSKAYEHKAPIHSGMTRNKKTYEKSSSSTYVTFRRVSQNSDINSWIHKGIKARNLMQKGMDNADLDSVASKSIANSLSEL